MTSTALLNVDKLDIDFTTGAGAHAAVRDLSFTVAPGEIVALVGESGSGKSVTSLALIGLLPEKTQVRGRAMFGDVDLLTLNESQLNKIRGARISMVFQDPMNALDPVFPIGHQIDEVLRVHSPQLGKAERKTRVLELLRMVEIPEPERRIRSYPHQLSGGQAQRTMIAMALACEPELLIADEPTTALDVTVQREVLDVLRRLRDKTGMAILIITHDMGVVADIADRVVVLRNGVMQETADVQELFDMPRSDYTQKLLAAVPRMGAPERLREIIDAEPVLEIEDLSVVYGRGTNAVNAITAVSLNVALGETVAIVGESGSGKSTIGMCALGLTPVTSGSLRIDGVDLHTAPRRVALGVKRTIGVVFQNSTAALDPRMTIGTSIEEPLRTHERSMSAAARAKRTNELLDHVELPPSWSSRYPYELSGGQRQRVAIARAIALKPRLLVADEPTSALDVSVQERVLTLLKHLQGELGFACLFISHDLAVVDQLSDRVVVLRGGRIVEQGERFDLLTRPQEEYTRRLLEAAPLPDPRAQAARRLSKPVP